MQGSKKTHLSSWANYIGTLLLALASFFTLGGCLPASLFEPTPAPPAPRPGSSLPAEVRQELAGDANPANTAPSNLSTASPAEKILDGVAKTAGTGAAITGSAAPAAGPHAPTLILISTALSAIASIASYLRDRLRAKSTNTEKIPP
jgi:hypothetical protein